jgi:hypothetical protein
MHGDASWASTGNEHHFLSFRFRHNMEHYVSFSISDDTFLSSYDSTVFCPPLARAETSGRRLLRISWTAHWPIPSSVIIFPTFTRRFSLIRSSIFPPFLYVDTVGRRPQWRSFGHVCVKATPLQTWTGPKGSRRLRLPDFKTMGTWRLSELSSIHFVLMLCIIYVLVS